MPHLQVQRQLQPDERVIAGGGKLGPERVMHIQPDALLARGQRRQMNAQPRGCLQQGLAESPGDSWLGHGPDLFVCCPEWLGSQAVSARNLGSPTFAQIHCH